MTEPASRVWAQDMSAVYDEHLVPAVFLPYAEDLAARVAEHAPRDVLELAAGTGVLTGQILQRLPAVRVTATDLNVAMVDVGAVRVPGAGWQQADAMDLPFEDGSFDLVACQFGVMFLPDRAAGFAGIRRVLRPGAPLVFNTWGPLAEHDVELAVIVALAELFPADPPTFLARIPHGYHDVERIEQDLTSAGFGSVTVETVALECTGKSAADLARGYCFGTPLRPEIQARGDLEQTSLALADALTGRFGVGPVTGRMTARVVTAL